MITYIHYNGDFLRRKKKKRRKKKEKEKEQGKEVCMYVCHVGGWGLGVGRGGDLLFYIYIYVCLYVCINLIWNRVGEE